MNPDQKRKFILTIEVLTEGYEEGAAELVLNDFLDSLNLWWELGQCKSEEVEDES